MKTFRCLLLLSLLIACASAEEYIVTIHGPLEMTDGTRTIKVQDRFNGVLLSSGQGSVRVRPLVFVHKDQVDKQGNVLAEQAEVLVEPSSSDEQSIAAVLSKGSKLQILRSYGDWMIAYNSELPVYTSKTPRWFHPPAEPGWTADPPGLSSKALTKLLQARTPAGTRFPFVVLPSWLPAGYSGSLERIENDDRFGPSYRVLYRKGHSTIGVQYSTGGIGDRWFEKPAKTVKVEHPFLGSITTALLKTQSPGGWTTNWVDVPGVMNAAGDRYRTGNLGLTFDKSIPEADIKRVLQSLKAVKISSPSESLQSP